MVEQVTPQLRGQSDAGRLDDRVELLLREVGVGEQLSLTALEGAPDPVQAGFDDFVGQSKIIQAPPELDGICGSSARYSHVRSQGLRA